MTTLFVKKIDETTLAYDADNMGTLYELNDYFSFIAPNARYDKRFQNHLWDGYIHLCPPKRKTTMFGLYSRIKEFCKERDITFEDVTEPENVCTPDDISNLNEFVKGLKLPFEPRDYQMDGVKFALSNNRGLLISPTGCHAKGSLLRMSDGSAKAVEDIKVGDKLLGVKGESREVLKLWHGRDKMYKISSIQNRFKPFVVNSEHILPLWSNSHGRVETISVADYVTKSKTFKHTNYLLLNDSPVEFSNSTDLKIDPYFMGLYLGDGSTYSMGITTADTEISEYVTNYVNTNYKNLHIRISNNGSKASTYHIARSKNGNAKNELCEDFLSYGLSFKNNENRTSCEKKFIPLEYKTSSVENRYKLLAGLIDSDGCLSATKTYYDITMKSKQLILDVIDVARSLGFVCTFKERVVKGVTYYRTTICGDVEKIPTNCMRKQTLGASNRNVNPHHVRFTVEELPEDEYFGVMTDGDHLYYNDDYVLNHNSGKSLILYILLRWHYSKGRKICLIVPSTSLVEQMISDFNDYSVNDDSFDAKTICKGLYNGTGVDPTKENVVVSTWQSLMHYSKEVMERWDAILVDECHGASAKVLQTIVGQATNAPYKIGMTGSLSGKDIHEFIITGLFGKLCQVTTTLELQKRGSLAPLKIYMVTLKHNKGIVKDFYNECVRNSGKKPTYSEEIEFLCDNKRRQEFVRNLACNCKGVTMVLFNRKKQGTDLFNLIKEKVGDSRKVFHIDGDVDAETREEIRSAIFETNDAILVASVGTSATGLNIPSIANVILCPSKSRIRNLQSIGRGLRTNENKDICRIFDLVDDFSSYRKLKSYSVKHGLERYELYQEQGFTMSFKTLDF